MADWVLGMVGLMIVLASPALRRFLGGWLTGPTEEGLAEEEGGLAPAKVRKEPVIGRPVGGDR